MLVDPSIDLFLKVAWLQYAFLAIHPFGDGNGRVARIISSLPLLKMNLSPVVVRKEVKEEYFVCLNAVDKESEYCLSMLLLLPLTSSTDDFMPLRNFLRRCLLDGVQTTLAEGRKPVPKGAPKHTVGWRHRIERAAVPATEARIRPSPTASPAKATV